MFQKLRYKFAIFMQGRNGYDDFTRFLVILWIALWVIFSILTKFFPILSYYGIFSIIFFIYTYFRVFSKNLPKRQAENYKYIQLRSKVVRFFKIRSSRMKKRKTNHIYKCPTCGQLLSVPRGRGKINIKCPKCHTQFTKRS